MCPVYNKMAFANKKGIDLTNYVQKVSDDLQQISAEISYDNPVDKPTDPATRQYVDPQREKNGKVHWKQYSSNEYIYGKQRQV